MIAPPIGYGASGEHEGFPGTVSIGTAALRAPAGGVRPVGLRLGVAAGLRQRARRKRRGRWLLLRHLLRYEGRDVAWCSCSVPSADAHAGHTETSVLLHISPEVVRTRGDGCRATARRWPSCCLRCATAGSRRSVRWAFSGTPPPRPRPTVSACLPRWSTGARGGSRRWTPDRDGMLHVTGPRLPDGFAVQVDRRVKVLGEGSALLGGSPTRLLRLAPAAQTMLNGGRLEVHDALSAQLARTLLDATVAHPRPASGPSHRDVTVVIPVRDNDVWCCTGWFRRCAACGSWWSTTARRRRSSTRTSTGLHCDVQVLRHPRSKGPAAARNTGLAVCNTDFVAFLDSDVVPRRGWLEALLGHFCDPAVALVAPRIVEPGASRDSLVARYEAVRSSLDLGQREAPVVPYGTVSYVPSAAIICRRSALTKVGGFDETLKSGEDVDLCWRFVEAGARLRYEPIALVAHDHRTQLREWFARKAFYGSVGGAAVGPTSRQDRTAGDLRVDAGGVDAARDGVGDRLPRVDGGRHDHRPQDRQLARHGRHRTQGGRGRSPRTACGRRRCSSPSAICRHYWPIALIAGAAVPALQTRGAGRRRHRRRRRLGEAARQRRRRHEAASACSATCCSSVSTTSPTGPACGRAWFANGTSARSSRRSGPEAALHSDVLIVGAGSAGSVASGTPFEGSDRVASRLSRPVPAPSDPKVSDQITDAVRMPIGAASSVVRHYATTLTDEPRPDRPHHARRGGRRVRGRQRRLLLPRAALRTSTGGRLPGWSWADVLPHFLALENDLDFVGPLHGDDGPILVRRVAEFDGCTASFVDAATEMGYPWIADLNGASTDKPLPAGVGAVPLNIDRGIRIGPGGAFLQPALGRPNLTLMADTRVLRITFDRLRAVGVECVDTGRLEGADRRSNRAVRRGNRIGAALDAVRRRTGSRARGCGNSCRAEVSRSESARVIIRNGCCRSTGRRHTTCLRWRRFSPRPTASRSGPTPRGFGAMVEGAGDDPADRPHIGVALMHPGSRGRMRVVSDDPAVAPLIEHRYDSDPHDVTDVECGRRTGARVGRPRQHKSATRSGRRRNTSAGPRRWVPTVMPRRSSTSGAGCAASIGYGSSTGRSCPSVTGRGPHATIVMLGHRAAEFVVA